MMSLVAAVLRLVGVGPLNGGYFVSELASRIGWNSYQQTWETICDIIFSIGKQLRPIQEWELYLHEVPEIVRSLLAAIIVKFFGKSHQETI